MTTARIIWIDIFGSASDAIVYEHFEPLEIVVQLGESEKMLCRSNPSQIAPLHIDADNRALRVPILSLNCDIDIRVCRTSSYAVASQQTSSSTTFRTIFPGSTTAPAGRLRN